MHALRLMMWLTRRRLLASWLVALALGMGVLAVVTVTSLVALRSRTMAEAGLHYALDTRLSEQERAVQMVVQGRPLGYQDYHDLSVAVQKAMEKRLGWLPLKAYPGGQAQSLPFVNQPEDVPPALGPPRAYLYFRESFEEHARIIAGRWPIHSTESPATLEVAIGESVATRMGWSTGKRLFLVPPGATSGERVEVVIVGIMQPLDAEESYWLGNLSPFNLSDGDSVEAPLYTTQDVFFHGFGERYPMLLGTYWWYVFLGLDNLTAGTAHSLQESLASLETDVNLVFPRSLLLTRLDGFLQTYDRDLALSRLPLYVFAFLVVTVVLCYLALMALMVAPERGTEAVMLRSRGATTLQVAILTALGEAFVMVVPAAVAGPLLAWGLNSLLTPGYSCAQCSVGLSPMVFLPAVLASATCIMVFLAAGLWVARRGIAQFLQERGRPGGTPVIQRYGIELMALVLLGLLWWQIRGRGGFVTERLLGAGVQADLSLVMAPALMLLAAGILGLRLYPWLLRLLAILASALGTAWVVHAFRRMARDPLIHASLAVLVMQAVALGVFGAVFGTTLAKSVADRAGYLVGGDVVTEFPEGRSAPQAVSVEDMSRKLRALPGVDAVSLVYRGKMFPPGGGVVAYDLLAVEPADLAPTAWFRQDLAGKDMQQVLSPLNSSGGPARGVALPSETQAIGLWVRPSSSHPGYNLYLRLRDAKGNYENVPLGNLGSFSWAYLEAPVPQMVAPLEVMAAFISGVPSSGYGSGWLALDDVSAVVHGQEELVAGFESSGGWVTLPYDGDSQLTLAFTAEAAHSGGAGALYSWTKPISDAPQGIFIPPGPMPIPAVGSSHFATGQTLVGRLDTQAVAFSVKETVPYFPTLYPDSGAFLVVNWDQLQRYRLAMLLPRPLDARELWIKVSEDSQREQVLKEIKGLLPPQTILKDRQVIVAQVVGDPLSGGSWPRLAAVTQNSLLVIMLIGFMLYTVIGFRRAVLELAILRAIGLSRYQTGWLLAVEAGTVGLVGLAWGLGMGTWVSRWVLSYMGLTSQGHPVTPPMELVFNTGLVLLTVGGTMVATAVAIVLAHPLAARLPVHEVLRTEE